MGCHGPAAIPGEPPGDGMAAMDENGGRQRVVPVSKRVVEKRP